MTVKEISEAAELSPAAQALAKDDSTPATYVDSLEKQPEPLYPDAIKFMAFQMEAQSAVKWACACVRELQAPELKDQKNETLDACEQWTKSPNDEARWTAKKTSDKAKPSGSTKLIAMGVFFSGGTIAGPGAPETPPPKNLAQKMLAGSVQSVVMSYKPETASDRYKRALAIGKGMSQAG